MEAKWLGEKEEGKQLLQHSSLPQVQNELSALEVTTHCKIMWIKFKYFYNFTATEYETCLSNFIRLEIEMLYLLPRTPPYLLVINHQLSLNSTLLFKSLTAIN